MTSTCRNVLQNSELAYLAFNQGVVSVCRKLSMACRPLLMQRKAKTKLIYVSDHVKRLGDFPSIKLTKQGLSVIVNDVGVLL